MRTHSWAKSLPFFGAAWLLFVLVPAYAQFETVQWRPLGPTGGQIRSLIPAGQDIYAGGTGGAVFRSSDNGLSWTPVSDSLPPKALIHDLQVIGTDLYAGTSNGIFRLASGAGYWEGLNQWPASALSDDDNLGPDVRAIALIGEELFAGTLRRGLYVFDKTGQKWKSVAGIGARDTVWALTGNESVGLAATPRGVFRRTGSTWTKDTKAPSKVRCFAKGEAGLYAGADNGVYALGATADSWTRLNPNFRIRQVNSLSVNGTRLLAGTRGEGRVYRATNLRNWSESGSGFTVAGDVTDVLEVTNPTGGGFLLAANQVGISRTPSDALGWRQSNQGLINTEINDVIVAGDTVYAGAAGAVYAWRGTGTEWRVLKAGLRANTTVNAILKHQDRLYCATSNGAYYLPDGDTTWVRFTAGLLPGDRHRRDYRLAALGEHLFMLTEAGVYRSTNGQPWQLTSSKSLPNNFHIFERLVASRGRLYVFRNRAFEDNQMYRSDSLGENWINLKAPKFARTGLTAHRDVLLANFASEVPGVLGIYRSANQGESWDKISSSRSYDIASNGTTSVFSATTFDYRGDPKRTYERLNFSGDDGVNWSVISNESLPQGMRVKSIEATDSLVLVSSWEHGVWMLPLSELYPPTVAGGGARDVTATTATLTGTAGAAVFGADFRFEYGTDPGLGTGVTKVPLPEAARLGTGIALSHALTGLEENTTYYYRVVGTNSGKVVRQSAIHSFRTHRLTRITGEQKPDYPFIDGNTLASRYPLVWVTLNPEYPPQTRVNLWVKGLREKNFTRQPLQPEGNAFRVQLPSGHLDSLGLQYYFELLPAPGYGPDQTTPPVTLAVRHPAGLPVGGLDFRNKQYQLLAFPLDLERKELADALGDEMPGVKGSQDLTRWRVVTYNKRSDPFDNLSSSSLLQPGVGYFVATTDPVPQSFNPGSGNTVALHAQMADGYFAISLQADDWTLIGNPFPWDVDWNYVREFNRNPDWLQFWAFDNNSRQLLTPEESNKLFRFGGGYVKNNSGQVQELRIPSGLPTGLETKPGPAGEMPLEVNFTLRTPQTVVRSAGLGLHPLALPGADSYDLELPPTLGETPSLHFVSESPAPLMRSILPPTGAGQSWEFTVTGVPEDGQPVVLAWQVKPEVGQALWLHDLTTEQKADMRVARNYAFRGNRRFRVYYGPASYIGEHLQPERYLVAAYPNPFADQTAFRFTLPPGSGPYRVRLTLADAQGRSLGTIAEGSYESGFHEVPLPLGHLPAGVYAAEATVEGEAVRMVRHLKLVRQ